MERSSGFAPVIDDRRPLSARQQRGLHAYESRTGRLLFEHQLGTGQNAPLVLGDGKLYVGTENGRFFTCACGPTASRS